MAKEPRDSKLLALMKGIGIDEPEKITKGTAKDALKYGRELNHFLGMGKKAVNQLNSMQGRNPDKEIIAMGCDVSTIAEKSETVEEFGNTAPMFICAESTVDQKLRMAYDSSALELKAGQAVCMTAAMYKNHVDMQPTLIPSRRKFSDCFKPYRGEDLAGKTLFVWRSGGIGDLLFIRPILMAFKEKYEGIKIIFATKTRYHSMVEQWDDCIDELSMVPFDVDSTLDAADYHISYEGLIERCKEAELMDAHDLFAKHSHIEIKNYNRRMKCICQNRFFDVIRNEYAVVQIGSSSPIRTPWHGKMIEVIDHLTESIDVIISGSQRETRTIDDIISCCKRPERIINFSKFTGSIVDAVKLVTGAKIVVAPDSSHVHMAAAQGVPCVGIYGPFPARVRTEHYENFIGVEPDESDACTHGGKGCFTHSHLPCHWGTKCWHHLDTEKITNAIDKLMEV